MHVFLLFRLVQNCLGSHWSFERDVCVVWPEFEFTTGLNRFNEQRRDAFLFIL